MRPTDTAGRVEASTPGHINESIRRQTECSAIHYAQRPHGIDERIAALDREWNIERVLQAQAAGVVLLGLVMSIVRSRRWLGLSAFSGYFLLQHAVQGWCPPVAAFRRAGVRTAREIEIERVALKALRGDFGEVGVESDPLTRARMALAAADGRQTSEEEEPVSMHADGEAVSG